MTDQPHKKRSPFGRDPMWPGDNPLSRVRTEINDLLDRFLGNLPISRETGLEGLRLWAVDVDQNDREVIVRAEAPGFEPDEFDVQLHNDQLTIRADKKDAPGTAPAHGGAPGTPSSAGGERRSYRRTVTLPGGIDRDKVEATYRNGVLEVRIAKTPETQGKHISVKG